MLRAALIPDGYCAQTSNTTTTSGSKLYTCPVKDCDGAFLSIYGVDEHFKASGHIYTLADRCWLFSFPIIVVLIAEQMLPKKECFNDNLDGTLTLVDRRPGPATVISWKPLDTRDDGTQEPPQAFTASATTLNAEGPVPTAAVAPQRTKELGTVRSSSGIGLSGCVARDHDREEQGSKNGGEMQTQTGMEGEQVNVTSQGTLLPLSKTLGQKQQSEGKKRVINPNLVFPPKYYQHTKKRDEGNRLKIQGSNAAFRPPADITRETPQESPQRPRETVECISLLTDTSGYETEDEPEAVQERRRSTRLANKQSEKDARPPSTDPDANTRPITETTPQPEKQKGPVPETPRNERLVDSEKSQEPATPTPAVGLRRSPRHRRNIPESTSATTVIRRSPRLGGVQSPSKPESKRQPGKRKRTPSTTPSKASKKRMLDNASNAATSGSTEEDDDDEITARTAVGVVGERTKFPFRRHNFHCGRRGPAGQTTDQEQSNAEPPSSFPLPPSPRDSSVGQGGGGSQVPRPSFLSTLLPGSDADVFADPLVPAAAQQQQQQTPALRPRDGFELEDWEIAPGMIRRDGTSKSDFLSSDRSFQTLPLITAAGISRTKGKIYMEADRDRNQTWPSRPPRCGPTLRGRSSPA